MKWYLLAAIGFFTATMPPDGAIQGRSPESIVRQFCQYDAEGRGLSSVSGKPMWDLTFGEGDRSQLPIVAISGFSVLGVRREQGDFLVSVRYDVEGEMLAGWDALEGDQLRVLHERRDWTFRLGQGRSGLAIRMESVPLAHVTTESLASYLDRRVLPLYTRRDAEERLREERIRGLVQQLSDLARSRKKK